jgi:hypothetical protein
LQVALLMLVSAKSVFGTDEEVTKAFFKGRIPADSRDWISAELEPLITLGKANPTDVGESLQLLIEAAFSAVDRVVKAESYDRWLPGQYALGGLLKQILWIINYYLPRPPLAIKASLDQLEEIKADSNTIVCRESDEKGYFLKDVCGSFLAIGMGILDCDPEHWKQRIMQERAIIPEALKDVLLADLFEDHCFDVRRDGVVFFKNLARVPEGWDRLSPGLAVAFAAATANWEPFFNRTWPFSESEVRASKRPFEALACMKSQDPLVLEALRKLTANSSWWPATGTDKSGIAQDAPWKRLLPWLDENREALLSNSAAIRTSMCVDEIRQVTGDIPLSNLGEAQVLKLRQMRTMYPYSYNVLGALGVAEDQSGSPTSALQYIQDSIVAFPVEWMHWQSLGVVLRRLGHELESKVAVAIATMIRAGQCSC